jgi:hypothetical protein
MTMSNYWILIYSENWTMTDSKSYNWMIATERPNYSMSYYKNWTPRRS